MIIHCDTTRFIYEVLEGGEYSFLFDGLRVLDLGCNIGTFSLWIYPHASKIWAIDKEQSNLDLFGKTIKDNNLQNINLYLERVINLSGFMAGHDIKNVDVLKIDIEGDEYAVFSETFPKNDIATIIGEYHMDTPEPLLSKLGYRYTELPNKHFIARR